jgi:hypothetical protein
VCGAIVAGLEIARLQRCDRLEQGAIGLEVDQWRTVQAVDPADQKYCAFGGLQLGMDVPIGSGRTDERNEKVPMVPVLVS